MLILVFFFNKCVGFCVGSWLLTASQLLHDIYSVAFSRRKRIHMDYDEPLNTIFANVLDVVPLSGKCATVDIITN